MKKLLSIVLIALLLAGMFTLPTSAAKEMFLTLSSVSVSGVVTPVVGQKPSATAVSDEAGKYTVAKVAWSEYDKDFEHVKDLGANDTFREGYYYFVFVNLEAKSSYTFEKDVAPTINGKTANKYTPSDAGKKVQIYTHFEAKKEIKKVDLTVVNPVVGKTPTFAKVDTAEYLSEKHGTVSNCSNGVTWTNQSNGINITVSNPFKDGTKYTVTYYLTAKDGYTFTSATAGTVNGAKATIELTDNSHAKVSLGNLVPGDGKKEIGSLNLSVSAPKEGAKPDYTKIDGTGYYSDNGLNGTSTKIYKNGIAWYKSSTAYIGPGTTETFKGNTEYTLKISLLPKDGYKFGKSLTALINGKTASVESFDDGSVTLSVKLTSISKDHKHIASGWKNDNQYHWKECTECGSLVGEKEAHTEKGAKCTVCGCTIILGVEEEETLPSDKKEPSNDSETPLLEEDATETDGEATEEENDDSKKDDKKDTGKKKNGKGWILWVVIGVVVLLGAGGTVTFLLLKKKKEQTSEVENNE